MDPITAEVDKLVVTPSGGGGGGRLFGGIKKYFGGSGGGGSGSGDEGSDSGDESKAGDIGDLETEAKSRVRQAASAVGLVFGYVPTWFLLLLFVIFGGVALGSVKSDGGFLALILFFYFFLIWQVWARRSLAGRSPLHMV